MKQLNYKSIVEVQELPPVTGNEGVLARLAIDQRPYWCNGVTWVDLGSSDFGRNGISIINPIAGSATLNTFGIAAPTAGGTATARTPAVTNVLTRMKRIGYVSSTSNNNYAGHYTPTAFITTGSASGWGGFSYVVRFGISDTTLRAAARTFVGLSSSVAAPTNVAPGTLINSIGVGNNANETNLSIYYGGTSAQTPISLGVNFPVSNTTAYELTLISNWFDVGYVYYRVVNLDTKIAVDGIIGNGTTTLLPTSSTLLAHRAWRFNNSAVSVGLDIASVYIETLI